MSKKLIWDLPVRVVHWLLTVLICGSYYTVEITGDMDTHMLIGQTVLCLLLFRVVWGFLGTRYARFENFVFKPAEVWTYARSFFSRTAAGYAGHNPMGSLAVFAMLFFIGVQVTTGLFATDGDFYAGPLNDLVSNRAGNQITNLHEVNFSIIAILIGLHIVAVLFYLLYKRENLITPMITGNKIDQSGSLEPIDGSRLGVAIAAILIVAGVVYAVVNYL